MWAGPIQFSRMIDVGGAVGQLRYQAGWATKIQGETNEISAPGEWLELRCCASRSGVVGQIVPWNFPLAMACGKLGRRWPRGARCAQAGRADAAVDDHPRRAGTRGGFPRA
jgi:acyl-CoA reductase-like NAD-dependent aldehyde dehydrogenase